MILQKIVNDTRLELENIKKRLPLEKLEKMAIEQTVPLDLASALWGGDVKLIAEIKKASPSRGVIRDDFDPLKIAKTYASNGAAAISVLTEPKYFQGSLDYLKRVGDELGNKRIPLLRKDFIFDPYQVYQSRAYGADSLLLIVAVLEPEKLKELLSLSHRLGMKCLVEVHNEAELEIALGSSAGIIGINNRDLNTFEVDLATTERLRPLIPSDRIVVSESGIKNRNDMEKLKVWGVNAALVGEALMSSPDIADKMRGLLWQR
ncbi:MAG: indole-3-glycerol phosphate synthase TrpC [Chloroflexota bacterium]